MKLSKKYIRIVFAVALVMVIMGATTNNIARAQEQETSTWSCYGGSLDGPWFGQVTIWWGHTAGDAAWACNNWISACGNYPNGCFAEREGGGGRAGYH